MSVQAYTLDPNRVPEFRRMWLDADMTIPDICDAFAVSERVVRRYARELGLGHKVVAPSYKVWTEDRLAILREGFERGESFSLLAKRLGCTRNAALAKAHRMGWHREVPSAPNRAAAGHAIPNRTSRLGGARNGAAIEASPPKSRIKAPLPLPGSHPKPWTERALGECAAPVGERDGVTLSCCKPCEKRLRWAYCPDHLVAYGQLARAAADLRSLSEARAAA